VAVASGGVVTAGVLLAAGGGSRFTGPSHKLLTEVGGRPLVAYAIAALAASGLSRVAVVSGAVDLSVVVPDGVEIIENPHWAEGQATSLAAAVGWARLRGADALAIGLGDQPGITPAAWQAVAATGAPIAIATYGGRRGHPVLLRNELWDRLPSSGDAGARTLIAGSPELVVEVPCEGDPADVDTVEDLARWR
jgi:molybdenum cofactor cytidylyltransferase